MGSKMIGIAQMEVSTDGSIQLCAPNLGSCLGVAVYDTELKLGGMIHCLLPMAKSDPDKAKSNPCMYVDSGVSELLNVMFKQGAKKERIKIYAVGGANINDDNNIFEIGKKNYTVFRKMMWKNNMLINTEDVGGACSRTLTLFIDTGKVTLKAEGNVRDLN
jgi:chemotaxis protein CheD